MGFDLASRLAAISVAFTMIVPYLSADQEAVTSKLANFDDFVKADPFPFLLLELILLALGLDQPKRKLWHSARTKLGR